MQEHRFGLLGRQIALWTHPEPEHLGAVIRQTRTFYEIDLLMKCREIYIPGSAVVDVGANIGNHTVFFAAMLGARVHAFEPYPPNQELLELNVAVNDLVDLVTTHRCALGETSANGKAQVEQSGNLGRVRISSDGGEIRVHALDEIIIDTPIGMIKIDVEGSELAVLRGAAETIRRWRPDLLVEAESAERFQMVARFLHPLGYAPRGRYAWTPTYLFSSLDQDARLQALLV